MDIRTINARLSVSPQIRPEDVPAIAAAGFRSIICNRPDGEEAGQPTSAAMAAAAQANGLAFTHLPVVAGKLADTDAALMANALAHLPGPVLAYCRSGSRSEKLSAMAEPQDSADGLAEFDIVIVGGGSAGIATAASILRRNRDVKLAVVEPSEDHYYQPGWTMVGAGVFDPEFTHRREASLIPPGAEWIKSAVARFEPDANHVELSDGRRIGYRVLIVCPGIKLDWDAIPGLAETLGRNGVTSNYRYDLAPYTHRLVREFAGGTAIFTQPPMPIKCAGAPQKAMYLSCHRWEKAGVLDAADVQFHTAGTALFGVPAYVPALMDYVDRYGIDLNFESKLVAIDGPARKATFEQRRGDTLTTVDQHFDMIHVVPPQIAPDFIRSSPLAAPSGFVAVDEATLQHPDYPNIFALGDACAASNAKTAAAARKQAPVVAVNALAALAGQPPVADYDGYGSCPLTVEAGKIVLAEFGYGGKLLPSFPAWLIDGTRPSRLSWLLKDTILPPVYWHGMLKGREWMVKPHMIDANG
ncbi:bifunctional protein tyrosine phosphatase family protein/NAD(P)/FAD-dependent oxidoreductase [Sphingopyxis sp. RIFCSPHIGHO2_12_FULL_65_19]|uniref:bifunctional protein tyrosine phosphatase family protein/NAD(P)/FAD-dependent oxidoreductase n=1 Tax=Sphingopyxis sp. RIFCSPHIGHO2_12_FULL_65_19 TaxID=1802172 RepID=UPI0008B988B0|nr:bifunctional protein tyrosine phosphatase family protein/NAD(P)/FAD-dependent oxidoreductase [Sphingopyxis sp. RIFCSPHIGHO2_12_FULL_65_19]OHD06286.1 MAG: TIGR01244 family protein [Sphingopyxis sp. RIFCSPHIGHO2_12_FULL_65_19]